MCSQECCLGSRHQPECTIFTQAAKKAHQMEERYNPLCISRHCTVAHVCFGYGTLYRNPPVFYMGTHSCYICMAILSRYALVMPIRVMDQVSFGWLWEKNSLGARWERRACWTRWHAWWTTWRTGRRRRPTSSSSRRRLLARSLTSVSRSLLSRWPPPGINCSDQSLESFGQ